MQQLSQGSCPAADTLATADIAATWNFTYDGDGNRVQQEYFEGVLGQNTPGQVTTYFMGGAYELDQSGVVQADGSLQVAAETTRKYYSLSGTPVAMTTCTGGTCEDLSYFLTDQLGSVIAVMDASGNLVEQQRYLPYGEARGDVGTITQTDIGFTGQRNLDAQGNDFSLGLMDYHARFYDSYITHFIQPDTIIPDLYDPQSLNRYEYARDNPIRYNDPSGHCIADPISATVCEAASGFGPVGWVVIGVVAVVDVVIFVAGINSIYSESTNASNANKVKPIIDPEYEKMQKKNNDLIYSASTGNPIIQLWNTCKDGGWQLNALCIAGVITGSVYIYDLVKKGAGNEDSKLPIGTSGDKNAPIISPGNTPPQLMPSQPQIVPSNYFQEKYKLIPM